MLMSVSHQLSMVTVLEFRGFLCVHLNLLPDSLDHESVYHVHEFKHWY